MYWKEKVFKNFRLYMVTDLTSPKNNILRIIEKAIDGGVDIVQLRSKVLTDNELIRIGTAIRSLTSRKRRLFFVNDRIDLALMLKADGVHIGQDDVSVKEVRRLCHRLGERMYIGKSTHSFTQAIKTAREDVDYIGVGPIYSTPTKKDYIPVGLSLINKVKSRISKPFVCIGGINQNNIDKVVSRGAERVAVVRAISAARDPYKAAMSLKRRICAHDR
jgi:thiamine-phosphate pyrophosphorylase